MSQEEKKMTALQFAEKYAKTNGVTLQRLAEEDWAVTSCDCDYLMCQGWTMESSEAMALAIRRGGIPKKGSVYYVKDMV